MTNPEWETNVQHLRRIYEPCVVGRNLKVNNSNHSAISVFYHAIFTLLVIIMAVIFATIVEHRRMLNIYWKTFLNIKQEIFNEMILRENTVFSFFKIYRSNGEKAYGIIIFINVAIYLAWNVTKWNSTMLKYFIINGDEPSSVWSHLLSAFSHTSLLSLTANAIYLYYPVCKLKLIQAWPIYRFSPYMGIEEFFVMYISACLFSSLSKIYVEQKLNVSSSRHGASGAISAVFGYVAMSFPNKQLLMISIIVRDELSVSVTAFEALLCLFFLIILIVFVLKFSWNNSISIISGCIFGMFWYKLGSKIIWDNRKYLTNVLTTITYICKSLYNKYIVHT